MLSGHGRTVALSLTSSLPARPALQSWPRIKPRPTLPEGWSGTDVGTTGGTGTATYAADTFGIQAYGADVWSTSDAFHFVHRPWQGDGEIVVQVTGLPLPAGSSFALAGVMFRESLAANARHASVLVGTDGKLKLRRRTSVGGTTLSDGPSAGSVTTPYWLKITRSGDVFTAYRSSSGSSWTQTGPALTLVLPAALRVGFWAARNGGTAPVNATFKNLSVAAGGWLVDDVGATGGAGTTSRSATGLVMRGAGSDLWSTSDAFHFAHRRWSGDGDLVVRVDRLLEPSGAAWAMAGITFRASLAADAIHASLLVSTEGKLKFRRRLASRGTTLSDGPSTGSTYAPRWLKLSRRGSVITAYQSADGTSWISVHAGQAIPLGAQVEIGTWTLRSGATGLSEAAFSQLSITAPTAAKGVPVASAPAPVALIRSTIRTTVGGPNATPSRRVRHVPIMEISTHRGIPVSHAGRGTPRTGTSGRARPWTDSSYPTEPARRPSAPPAAAVTAST